jgi:hypothetical protein
MNPRIIKACLVLLVLLGLSAYFGCDNQGGAGLKIINQNLTVHEFSGGPQSIAVVYGRAQNIKTVNIDSATISVNFYDKDKRLIATASSEKENLKPGESWDFSVQTVGPDAWKIVSYDISISIK